MGRMIDLKREGVDARKREERLLALEHSVTRCLAEAESATAALESVIRTICESEGWDSGRYFRWDDEANVLQFGGAWGIPTPKIGEFIERSRDIVFPPGQGLVGRVWQSNQPLWVADINSHPLALRAGFALDLGIRGTFVFPVASEGSTIGVLVFSSGEICQPDERLLGAVRAIGSQVGQFLRRARAEDVLRRSEERFRSLTELSSDMYWEQDDRYRFTVSSGSGPGWIVRWRRQALGKKRWDFSYLNMTERDWADHIALLDARKPFRDLELCRLDESGSRVWISVSGEPVFDPAGTFIGYRGVGKDITARKRADQLQALEHAVNRSLADADKATAAVQAAIRAICETEDWECGRYLRVDERAGVLRCVEAWGIQTEAIQRFLESSRSVTYAPGVGLAGRVWQSGEPLWLADIGKDPRAAQISLIRELGLHGATFFPVMAEGRTIGILAFNSREVREPEERLLQAIRVIGSQIGQFVQRKEGEEELRRFRLALDNSADMIVLIDRATMRFVDVNATACDLLGYSREEMLEMGPQDLLPVSRAELERSYDDLIANPSLTSGMNTHYRCRDGTLLPFESTRRVLRSGDTYIIAAISRDIRDRIAAETALRESNERFNTAVRATSDVIWDLNLITESLWWNENFTKVFGYPREDVDRTVKSWYDATHPDDRDRVEAGMRRLIASGGESWSDEYRFRRRDGSYAEVLDRGHVIRDGAGKAVRMIGAMEDVTSRKEGEEKMRKQALQQRLIAEFGQWVLASTGVADVLNRAVELVSATLKADYCNVLELDTDGKQLLFKAAAGWPAEWVGQRTVPVRPGNRIEFALSHREPVITKDYEDKEEETRFSPSPLLQFGVRSGVEVPIFGTAGTFGILSAHALKPRRFGEDDLSFLQSVANILALAIERKGAEERLAYLAQFDALTALPNRHLFHDRLLQTMAQGRRSGNPMAVLYIDLDRFKLVNDTQGHGAGDKLLKEAAARLTQCIRSGDTMGRFGGDEFGAVLSDLAKPGDASIVAQKMIDALARPFDLDGHETYVTASVGITLFPADSEEAGALIMNADTAMYRAKEQGRNTYQYFTREMNERALARMQVEAALRRGLERREFLLHYQPKVNLENGVICGFEALLRWQHPERGMVSPVEFIPVLEDAGLIVPVGEWVMREVCRQIQAWKSSGLSVPPVAVNLSARQFLQKDLEATVRLILRESAVDPSLIQFELTESLLMKEPEAAARTLRGLKESGVRISVDDFGTGYSSLAYLKRFPIDALKIDHAFIRDVTTNPEDAAIAVAIIGLAHSLKLKVVAEGVETEGQLNFLSMHACDEMQGYYFSRPVPPSECEAMMREGRRLSLSANGAVAKPVVLLLDDDERDLTLLEQILRPDGFQVLKTTDPTRAFELLASHPVGIVISDQNMPGLTGVEFLSHVRKLYPDVIRIVFTSSQNPKAFADAVNEAGIHKFIMKDWDGERLRAEVREISRRYRSKNGALPSSTN
jgi:diguanylate cyclase (GGDEF)-like protein/PAS domain S-box-containing protein